MLHHDIERVQFKYDQSHLLARLAGIRLSLQK